MYHSQVTLQKPQVKIIQHSHTLAAVVHSNIPAVANTNPSSVTFDDRGARIANISQDDSPSAAIQLVGSAATSTAGDTSGVTDITSTG
jgi:hypothetical protein